jgi:hypothetical protein
MRRLFAWPAGFVASKTMEHLYVLVTPLVVTVALFVQDQLKDAERKIKVGSRMKKPQNCRPVM